MAPGDARPSLRRAAPLTGGSMHDIERLEGELLAAIAAAPSLEALEGVRVAALGRQGSITGLLKTLGGMDPQARAVAGPAYNGLRETIAAALAQRRAVLEAEALERRLAAERLDMTLPMPAPARGVVHPVSQVMDELAEIFADLGFAVAEGPEIETEWYNFDALNFPADHPAREMHDTFFLPGAEASARGGRWLLRTHTSPVQIRAMLASPPPLRVIAPGRVYRCDSDATHTPMFHQVEGLVIDRGIHLGHLKGTIEAFVRAFFELDDVRLRYRPSFFPFTEPSMEVDVACSFEGGRVRLGGEGTRWMEIMGSGVVHPNVLRAGGVDPELWSGFAFGCGIDRLAMLKYGMPDLRPFFDADLRWLRHYGFAPLAVPTLSAGVGA
jgi:phenylalanyl-tRNA synthetase alpha chain